MAIHCAKTVAVGSSLVKVPLERIRTLCGVWQNGLAANSTESFIAQQAIDRYGFVAVLLHDLRCSELLIEIVNQTTMKYQDHLCGPAPYISAEEKRIATQAGAGILKFVEVEYNGTSGALGTIKPEPWDIAIINYNTKFTLFTSKDHLLSYFTNGDVIGTWMMSVMVMAGGLIGFPFRLMKKVLYNSQATTPTHFASTGSSFKKEAYASKLAL
ncbi:hypothetical protein KI688_006408 [Linnemannia hyalina]|uniref:Uncharacterized protein n=1 Tax=Linnemannia hyalina TaxID=64524 RepID=A0A9P7Y2L3_9FUNG|nr:hypothetical protein KI688_006408 [Linnemannia hyalina]